MLEELVRDTELKQRIDHVAKALRLDDEQRAFLRGWVYGLPLWDNSRRQPA